MLNFTRIGKIKPFLNVVVYSQVLIDYSIPKLFSRMAIGNVDIVIFGATGFTGKNTVKQAAQLSKIYNFTWAVAGRRRDALETVVKEFAPDFESTPIIIADVKNEESLRQMTAQANVIVNCCGPYRFYGEPVVKACVATGTHYVDVSGEPQFMEKMQLEYDEPAKEAGVYVVSACGVDSIPADLGVIFTQQKFNGDVNSIETYLKFWSESRTSGTSLNYGTWESAVYGYAHANELRELRRKLYPEKLPEFKQKLQPRGTVHCTELSEGYSIPFPGSDRSVCLRTQRFLYQKYKQRPAQIQAYVTFSSLIQFLLVAVFGGMFSLLANYKFGRSLLLNYPKLFSGGTVSRQNPKFEDLEKTRFSVVFIAKGWTEVLAEPTDQHKDKPNKEMITKVSGTNPGYGATCTMLLMSAIMILKESDKIPNNGGVLPPGAAFGKTSMIEELNKNGIKFEVITILDNLKANGNNEVLRLQSQFKLLSKL